MASANDSVYRFSIRAELAKMPPETAAGFSKKMKVLQDLMSKTTPYKVRDDSKLAHMFCDNTLSPFWTKEQVAHEMATIQWLSNTTEYVSLSQPVMREMAKKLKEEYGIRDWKVVWKLVSDYGPDLLKYDCMYNSGLQIPDFVPPRPNWADMADQESDSEC